MQKIVPLAFLMLLGCCGYSTRSLLPAYLETIHVKQVENSTLRPLLGEELTDELVGGFSRDGRLRVSSDPSADLILEVGVTSYQRTAAVYDASRNVTRWRYQLRYSGECVDVAKNTTLWEQTQTVSEVLDADEPEEEGIRLLLERSAEEIVRNVLLAW